MKAKCFLILLLTSLASCGENGTTTTSLQPTTLDVVRVAVQNDKTLSPFHKQIQNEQEVQQVYKSALALPKSQGTTNCLTSSYTELNYTLTFSDRDKQKQKMVLDANTCIVLRLSDNDTRTVDQSFMALFEKVMGIPSIVP